MCSLTSQAGWINAVMLQMVCNERNWLEIFSSSNNASQGFMLDAWSPADALVACADNIWCCQAIAIVRVLKRGWIEVSSAVQAHLQSQQII